MVEFVYNNINHANLGMSSFEALYARKCRTLTCWMDLNERKLVGHELVREREKKFLSSVVILKLPKTITKLMRICRGKRFFLKLVIKCS